MLSVKNKINEYLDKKTFEVTLTNTIVVDVEAATASEVKNIVLGKIKKDFFNKSASKNTIEWESGDINIKSINSTSLGSTFRKNLLK